MEKDVTEQWKKYESLITYNSTFKPDYYEGIKAYYSFYNGDQWLGAKGDEKLPHPVFNVIKRTVEFDIASLSNSNIAVNVEPLEYNSAGISEQQINVSNFVNSEIKNIFEKWNMRVKKKDLLLDAAITGDMCAHIIFDQTKKPYRGYEQNGELDIELIDSTNIGFGNPNIRDVQKQPWIIVIGRDMVKNLKEEAKLYRNKASDEESIAPDYTTEYQSTNYANTEIEIEEDDEKKALYIYIYEKKKGSVFVSKCTKDAVIFQDIDMQIDRYPIAFANWFKQKNTFHGRGMVEGIIPNQISINKMFAMVIYHLMMTAFPTAVYDKDVLKSWNNELGTAFGLERLNGRSIKDVAGYLEPANMSQWIMSAIETMVQYTKEFLGVSDAALGQIDPKNTSAIIAVQKSTAIPLENIKDNLYDLIEQVVLILLDMMASKYGKRPVVLLNKDGSRTVQEFDFSLLKDMDLKTSVDVGETSYYSEIAAVQTMDNLLQNGLIEMIDYLERIPKELIPRKDELISKLKEKEQASKQEGYEQMAQFIQTLPPQMQQQLTGILQNGWDVVSAAQPEVSGALVSPIMQE